MNKKQVCGECKLFINEDSFGNGWCEFHQEETYCENRACEDRLERGTMCYISCPITGQDIKSVNIWINVAKDHLLKHRYIPVSPLDVSLDVTSSYPEHMGKDITALLECEAVYFLRGWSESKGCQLEYLAAQIYGKKIMFE